MPAVRSIQIVGFAAVFLFFFANATPLPTQDPDRGDLTLSSMVELSGFQTDSTQMAVSLQTIVQQHFPDFAASHRLPSHMQRAAWAVKHCRTRELGGHVNSCPDGHYHQIAYNSCRHRSCPQCGWLPKEKWLDGWRKRLLPCPHHHVIFTVPHELNDIWRHNKSAFADTLFAAASKTLTELLGDTKYLGGRIGILAALHTWNQELQEHVHLHTIVTAGGLGNDGTWRKPKKKCLLPRKVLMIKFRGKFKAMLREKVRKGTVKLPTWMSQEQFDDLLKQLTNKPWNVKVYDAYRDGLSVATYLARYIKGGPIGNSRILSIDNGVVTFRYRLPARQGGDGKRQSVKRLPVDAFLARWFEHVPPKRFQTVRGYGLYSGNQHSRWKEAAAALGVGEVPIQKEQASWQEWCEAAGMVQACCCPHCGKQLISHHEFPAGRGPPVAAWLYVAKSKPSDVAGGKIA